MKYGLIVFLVLALCLYANARNNRPDYRCFNFVQSSVGSFGGNSVAILSDTWKRTSVNPFSSLSVEVQLPFSLNTIFNKSIGTENYSLDLGKMSSKAAAKNSFFINTTVNWLSISGSRKDDRWQFRIQEHLLGGIGFQDKFIDLIYLGNKPYVGDIIELKFPINELHFREYSFTYAKPFNKKMDVGLTCKLYLGKSCVGVKSDIEIRTNEDGSQIDFDVEGSGYTSVPVKMSQLLGNTEGSNSLINYFLGINNPGLGVDVGLVYRMNKKVTFLVNATDIGFFIWNAQTTVFEAEGSHSWSGIDISGIFDFNKLSELNEDPAVVSFRDSFLNNIIDPDEKFFVTSAPSALSGAANYQLKSNVAFQAAARVMCLGQFVRGYLAVNGSYLTATNWQFNAGFSISNNSFFNVPIGVGYHSKTFTLDFILNNLAEVILPEFCRTFGGSILFSYRFPTYKHDSNIYPFFDRRLKWK